MSELTNTSPYSGVTLALGAGCVLALASVLYRSRRRSRQPPSVGRYPLIGSHRHLKEPWYRSIHERFGNEPIVLVHQGLEPVYMLNSWPAFKEAMLDNAEALSGRVNQQLAKELFGDEGGIVSTDGELWREYRRFTLRALRDFGLGRCDGEKLIVEEAAHLCRSIEEAGDAGIECVKLFSTATSNIICQLVFGSRVASEDPQFDEILEVFRAITQNEDTNVNNSVFLSILPFINRFPQLMPLLTKNSATKKTIDDFNKLLDYCTQHKDKHKAEMENVKVARDYIEAHMLHQQQRPQIFNDRRLTFAVSDLFVAGTETTSNTLRWAVLYMIDHPDIAAKVREEIHDKFGRERPLQLSDKQQLPYVMATIEEVIRKSSLVGLGLMHRVTAPISVAGYDLPQDAICTFNVYSIQHDPAFFPEPQRFRPERHLSPDGGQFVPCEQLAAFGAGKRACLGEGLARSELFVFFATLMQRFSFRLDPSEGRSVFELTEDPELFKGSVMRSPPQHKILFTRI